MRFIALLNFPTRDSAKPLLAGEYLGTSMFRTALRAMKVFIPSWSPFCYVLRASETLSLGSSRVHALQIDNINIEYKSNK